MGKNKKECKNINGSEGLSEAQRIYYSAFWCAWLILVILKACGIANISWWWLTFMFWIPLAAAGGIVFLCLAALAAFGILLCVIHAIDKYEEYKENKDNE